MGGNCVVPIGLGPERSCILSIVPCVRRKRPSRRVGGEGVCEKANSKAALNILDMPMARPSLRSCAHKVLQTCGCVIPMGTPSMLGPPRPWETSNCSCKQSGLSYPTTLEDKKERPA